MQIVKNKTKSALIALFLTLTISITLISIALPSSNAHTPPYTVPTDAYVAVSPDTIGDGQYATIIVWLAQFSPTSSGLSGQRWDGFLITITQPDGKNTTIGPWTCRSAAASDYQVFTPTELGNYTIVFSWPGENVTTGNQPLPNTADLADVGDIFLGSTSKPCTLTVTSTQVPSWPEPPLPTDYWTTPINSQNRGWSVLASNWLNGPWLINNFQTEGTAPTTAHVFWTEPFTASAPGTKGYPGGIGDAQWAGINSNSPDYNNPWTSPIIMNGIIYYNTPASYETQHYGYYAVDLYTGQRLWYNNGTNPYTLGLFTSPTTAASGIMQLYPSLSNGQVFNYASVNGNGVFFYLWEQSNAAASSGVTNLGVWYMLDPSTGNPILSLTNVPTGTTSTDSQGDLLIYTYNANNGNLLCWNETQVVGTDSPTGTAQQAWRPPVGATINSINYSIFQNLNVAGLDSVTAAAIKQPISAYTMNVTIPTNLPGSMTILHDSTREPVGIFGSSFPVTYTGTGVTSVADQFQIWLASINEHAVPYSPWPTLAGTLNNNLGFTVTMNYQKTLNVPIPGRNFSYSITGIDYNSNVFILKCTNTMQLWGYSLSTGGLLWGPVQPPPDQMTYYGQSANIYNGIALDIAQYAGTIVALNATTGQQLWTYSASAAPYSYESNYGADSTLSIGAVCDGKIYTYSSEHSPTDPLWRESYVRCINMTDGTLIWKIEDFNLGLGIADGYLVSGNDYDNQIYCIGKGPSAMTVEAPLTATPAGSTVIIQGTVTDQSPGALAYAKKYDATNGVAAVSDDSQEAWMEYLYEQQAKPTNATGVPVSIDAIDPNGNTIHIGDATSDTSGSYIYSWTTPNVPGQYKIIASFEGSNSYGSSYAQTGAYVSSEQAAVTTSPPPVTSQQPVEIYVIGVGIAIAIIIAIGFAVTIIILRKRP